MYVRGARTLLSRVRSSRTCYSFSSSGSGTKPFSSSPFTLRDSRWPTRRDAVFAYYNNTSRVRRTTAPSLVDVSIQLSNSRLRKAHTDMHNIYSLTIYHIYNIYLLYYLSSQWFSYLVRLSYPGSNLANQK